MSSKPRELSGRDILKVLSRFGFFVRSQNGSHIKLRRVLINEVQTLIVPDHTPIKSATIKVIYRQACAYIPQEQLHKLFFTTD